MTNEALTYQQLIDENRRLQKLLKHSKATFASKRALKAHRLYGQIVIRENNEIDLFKRICKITVEEVGYKLAWIGIAMEDKTVLPVASAGFEKDYLNSIKITWGNDKYSKGPTGQSIKTGKLVVMQDILNNPKFKPWKKNAEKNNYKSSIAIPLFYNDEVFGSINIYSEEQNAFDEEEIRILQDAAYDLSIGVSNIRQIDIIEKQKSELKTAKEKAEQNEEKFRTIFNMSQSMICVADINTATFKFINPAFKKILGYDEEELLNKPFFNFIHPDDIDKTTKVVDNQLRNGKSVFYFENRYKCKNGGYCYLDWNSFPIPEKGITYAIARDITEQKLIETQLRETKDRYDLASGIGKVGIWDWDIPSGNLIWNSETYHVLGFKPGSVKPSYELFLDLVHKDDRNFLDDSVKAAWYDKKPYNLDCRVVHSSGKIVFCHVTGRVEYDYSGNPIRMLGTFQDITELKKSEEELKKHRTQLEKMVKERTKELLASNEELKLTNEKLSIQRDELKHALKQLHETQAQLVQSEKMASLGILMAGVAHEINNPVNFISSSLIGLKSNIGYFGDFADLYNQLLEDNLAVIETIKEKEKEKSLAEIVSMFKRSLEIIELGIERTKKIVVGLKSFTHPNEKKRVQYNIQENLDNTLLILHHQYKDRIEITKEYEQTPLIECLPGPINQVFMNILSNAIQAIKDKGIITITTKRKDNEMVCISIKDDGKGIPKENLNRIFDPFFTTKPVGKGTGLGLSISYNIVKEHHGRIKAESEPGKGTCFEIQLPIKYKK